MNILLTNDDGIQTHGIQALAKEASKRGHKAIVVAPKEQRSANSHYITLHNPIHVKQLKNTEWESYWVDGTPADCTRIALLSLFPEGIDMVISGINEGHNLGRAIIYSGTCGAAREAVICGKPAIASSINFHATEEMVDYAAKVTIDMAEKLFSTPPASPEVFLNLNFPALPPSEMKAPKMAYVSAVTPNDHYDEYQSPRKQRYFFIGGSYVLEQGNAGSDVQLLQDGHITLSFISIAEDKNILDADFLDK